MWVWFIIFTHIVDSLFELAILFDTLAVLQNMKQITLIRLSHGLTLATENLSIVKFSTIIVFWIPTAALSRKGNIWQIPIKYFPLRIGIVWGITRILQRRIVGSVACFLDSYLGVFRHGCPIFVVGVTAFFVDFCLWWWLHLVKNEIVSIYIDFVNKLIQTRCRINFHIPNRKLLHNLRMLRFIFLYGLIIFLV